MQDRSFFLLCLSYTIIHSWGYHNKYEGSEKGCSGWSCVTYTSCLNQGSQQACKWGILKTYKRHGRIKSFLPVSLMDLKRGNNSRSSLLPCISKIPWTGSLEAGQTSTPYGCMCIEVKEVCFLSFIELHENTYLLSLSASQKDLFVLHSYTTVLLRKVFIHPRLFFRKSLRSRCSKWSISYMEYVPLKSRSCWIYCKGGLGPGVTQGPLQEMLVWLWGTGGAAAIMIQPSQRN